MASPTRRARGLVDKAKDRLGRKQIPPGTQAGWSSGYGGFNTPLGGAPISSPRRIKSLLNAYGGTEDSDTWVAACISLIASTGASYDYIFTEPDSEDPIKNPPTDLVDLIREPNSEDTYFDFAEDVFIDMELAGNSYWLMDQQNGLGQPLEMLRLDPSKVQIVVDNSGRKSGYVYTVTGNAVQIPYTLDDVLHFRTRNPLNPYYGMGTVEMLIREIESDLSQTMHVNAFFNNGARISGILTSAEPMTDLQFQRVVQQFQEEYGGSANAYKMLIADGATNYRPISQAPAALGVIELRRLSKDAILSGFGVPEFLLGGAAQAGVYKMEEAQNIFYRQMLPRANRFDSRLSRHLCSRWKIGFKLKTGVTEPQSIRVARAKEMVGTGASLDQVLVEMGLPEVGGDLGKVPLLPGGIVPWYQAVGLEPPNSLPIGQNDVATASGDTGGGPNPGIPDQVPPAMLNAAVEQKTIFDAPDLPEGYEKLGVVKALRADPDTLHTMLTGQARFLHDSTPQFRTGFQNFFLEQRGRVLDRLSRFGLRGVRNPERAKYGGKPTQSKAQLRPDDLWDDGVEGDAIRTAFLNLLDALGNLAIGVANQAARTQLEWDIRHPEVERARNDLARLVTRINDTTREQIAEQVEVGLKRSYSASQIANGVPGENYPGILGVFDDATQQRALTIARTESVQMFNLASLAAFESGGSREVEVYDGVMFDQACIDANGSIWSLEEARADPLEHPNCVRFFVPL